MRLHAGRAQRSSNRSYIRAFGQQICDACAGLFSTIKSDVGGRLMPYPGFQPDTLGERRLTKHKGAREPYDTLDRVAVAPHNRVCIYRDAAPVKPDKDDNGKQ